jgi:hypothetical protein
MDFASQEVDEATARLEAEVCVPLTNILSGRVGHAADRALGGWVPLRSCLEDDDVGPLQTQDEIPPALWMQMYVLPDHADMVPKLEAQLNEVIARQPKCTQPAAAPQERAPAAQQVESKSAGYAQTSIPPRWGPGVTGKAAPQTQAMEDLIDVTLDDPHECQTHEPVSLLDSLAGLNLLDSDSTPAGLPVVEQGLPRIGTDLPAVSSFGFINQQEALVQQLSAQPPVQAGAGTSAFGFIAGASEAPKLDLAALYASSEAVKAAPIQPNPAKFSAFVNLTDAAMPASKTSAPSSKGAEPGSLESLEQSILADLKL